MGEGKLDDLCGKSGGSGAFGEADRRASVIVEGVAVITEFERGIDDAVSATAKGAVGTAVAVGVVGVGDAVVTDFPGVDTGVAAERRKRSDLGDGETAVEDAAGGIGTVGVG